MRKFLQLILTFGLSLAVHVTPSMANNSPISPLQITLEEPEVTLEREIEVFSSFATNGESTPFRHCLTHLYQEGEIFSKVQNPNNNTKKALIQYLHGLSNSRDGIIANYATATLACYAEGQINNLIDNAIIASLIYEALRSTVSGQRYNSTIAFANAVKNKFSSLIKQYNKNIKQQNKRIKNDNRGKPKHRRKELIPTIPFVSTILDFGSLASCVASKVTK